MFIDVPGSTSNYQPPLIVGPALLPRVNGTQALLHPDAIEHSATEVDQAAHAANKQMEQLSSQIRFNVSNEAGRTIVRMVDTQTKQVLLQIPNEQMMKIAQDPAKLQGLILDQKA